MISGEIGRYQILGEIGAGGFATVYRAHDPTLDRDVALKVLHAHLARDPSIRDRFIREGRSLARLHHPNLVQVYDAGESEGQVYLAMQFIPGQSLAERSRGRVLSLEELAPVVRQVAAALDEIHAAGLVHRDVKPANILVTETGRAVLLDLGIARDVNNVTATASSLIVGTPGYLAPEQVDSALTIGPRTDVYQLGATVYALLAGRAPFEGDTAQVLFAVVNRAPPDLGDLRPDLPFHVVGTIAEAMAKDATRRPGTAGAFASALTAGMDPTLTYVATNAHTRPAPPAAAVTQVRPPAPAGGASGSRKLRPLLLAGAGVLALLLVGGTVYARRNGGDGQGRRTNSIERSARSGLGGDPSPAATRTATGAATGTPAPKGDAVAGITAGGQPVTVEISKPGQDERITFNGKAGQFLSLGVTRVTTGATGPSGAYISVLDPDRREIVNKQWIGKDGGLIQIAALRKDGSHTIVVNPEKDGQGSVTLTLSEPVGGAIAVDGQDASVNIEREGQYARFTFDGTRGQLLSLGVTRLTIGGANPNGAYFSILDPDGRAVVDRQWIGRDGGSFSAPALRANGKYAVAVMPDQAETGAVTLTLSQPVGGMLTVDGQPTTVEIGRTGQYARLTFTATKDQRITLGASRVTIGASGPNGAYVSILDPDGKPVVDRAWVGRDGDSIAARPLRVAGTYAVVILPDRTDTGSLTLTLSQPVIGTIAPDGQPVSVSIERPGQHARLTFEGQRGQTLTLVASRLTLGTGSSTGAYFSVLDPDGKAVLNQHWFGRDGGEVKVPALTMNGTYTVVVEPERTDTGGVTLVLK